MRYEGDLATIQRRLAATSDLVRRRLAVLDALAPRPGEAVLEVGCGGGALLPPLAACVAPGGRVVGVDLSADQIAAAQALCADLPAIEAAVHDLRRLPHADAAFDAAAAVQVIEYLDRPAEGLAELRRVVRAGGRLAVLATNWDSVFWNCGEAGLTRRVLDAWRRHAPRPNLPAELRPLLEGAGFWIVRQSPVTILNADFQEGAFAYWAARLMVAFAAGQDLLAPAEGEAWLRALENAQRAGTFFFSSTPVLTLAVAA